MDGGETERRSATTDATTHGNDGRQRRTAAMGVNILVGVTGKG